MVRARDSRGGSSSRTASQAAAIAAAAPLPAPPPLTPAQQLLPWVLQVAGRLDTAASSLLACGLGGGAAGAAAAAAAPSGEAAVGSGGSSSSTIVVTGWLGGPLTHPSVFPYLHRALLALWILDPAMLDPDSDTAMLDPGSDPAAGPDPAAGAEGGARGHARQQAVALVQAQLARLVAVVVDESQRGSRSSLLAGLVMAVAQQWHVPVPGGELIPGLIALAPLFLLEAEGF